MQPIVLLLLLCNLSYQAAAAIIKPIEYPKVLIATKGKKIKTYNLNDHVAIQYYNGEQVLKAKGRIHNITTDSIIVQPYSKQKGMLHIGINQVKCIDKVDRTTKQFIYSLELLAGILSIPMLAVLIKHGNLNGTLTYILAIPAALGLFLFIYGFPILLLVQRIRRTSSKHGWRYRVM